MHAYILLSSLYKSIHSQHYNYSTFSRELTYLQNLDYQKLNLRHRADFDPFLCFKAIDTFSAGRLDFDNLRAFFKSVNVFPRDDEIVALLRRFDRDDDGQINFEEFAVGLELSDKTVKSANELRIKPVMSPPRKQSGQRAESRSPTRGHRHTASYSGLGLSDLGYKSGGSPSKNTPIKGLLKTSQPPTHSNYQRNISPAKSVGFKLDSYSKGGVSTPNKFAGSGSQHSSGSHMKQPESSAMRNSGIFSSGRKAPGSLVNSPERRRVEEELYEAKLKGSTFKPKQTAIASHQFDSGFGNSKHQISVSTNVPSNTKAQPSA